MKSRPHLGALPGIHGRSNSEVLPFNRVPTNFHVAPVTRAGVVNLRLRSDMMNALIAEIEDRGLTQAQAAKLLGVSQLRISDLMRGKLHLFSIDMLVTLLSAAGLRVEMKVRRAA